MYRCYACDAPAQLNCECYTQVETPESNLQEQYRINVSSGEDAHESKPVVELEYFE